MKLNIYPLRWPRTLHSYHLEAELGSASGTSLPYLRPPWPWPCFSGDSPSSLQYRVARYDNRMNGRINAPSKRSGKLHKYQSWFIYIGGPPKSLRLQSGLVSKLWLPAIYRFSPGWHGDGCDNPHCKWYAHEDRKEEGPFILKCRHFLSSGSGGVEILL